MNRLIPCLIAIVNSFNGWSQVIYENVKFLPRKPEAGQLVQIEYSPPVSIDIKNTQPVVFLCKAFEERSRFVESSFEIVGTNLLITIPSAEDDVSLLFVLTDTLGNTTDNNDGFGYWTSLHKEGNAIPASFASIANIYYGSASAEMYKLKPARDLAKTLFEQGFSENPLLKRFYWRFYISAIRYEGNRELFSREIVQFSSLDDLSESELLAISRKFYAVGDTSNSRKFEKMVYQKFPMGEWALQTLATADQIKYLNCKSAEERIRVVDEHMTKFSKWPKNEGKRRYLEAVRAVIFFRGVDDYVSLNRFDEWEHLTDSLRPNVKFRTYYLTAKRMYEKNLISPYVVKLIDEACDWREQNLSAPRVITDWPFMTNLEVRYSREKELSEWLEVYAAILRLLGRNEESRDISLKAQLYSEHQLTKIKNKPPMKFILEPTPSISFSNAKSNSIELSNYKNKVLVLDFWASWCAPCIEGFKKMNELEKLFSNKEIQFLFVSTMEKGTPATIQKRAKKIIDELGYNFKLVFDFQNRSGASFDISALPTIVIIDKGGMIRFRQVGSGEIENLKEVIAKLIN